MTRAAIFGGAGVAVLGVLAVAAGYRALHRDGFLPAEIPPASTPSLAPAAAESAPAANPQGFLYGRITAVDGATFEGRLRWGGGQEAFWGDYFNGAKRENSWAARVPPELLPKERRPLEVLGLRIAEREHPLDLGRLFMARFGDLARIEASRTDVRVTLKSGSVVVLDRFEASDFDDGVRVWDGERGVVDLDTRRIRAIELLPTARLEAVPSRLHGTVRTAAGDFTGFLQWNREVCVGSDEIHGRSAEGEIGLRFDALRSIARETRDSVRATLLDGREIVLSGSAEAGDGHRGVYVDDRRYGRVLVSWDAFERADLDDAGRGDSGPAYGDFPPGRPLAATVTTRDGRRLAGRLVYDLDESETTETLDAPARGVDYTIPFGSVAAIALPDPDEGAAGRVRVTLQGGEELRLERAGDLGPGNLGCLVFVEGRPDPEYVPWAAVERIDFDPPPSK